MIPSVCHRDTGQGTSTRHRIRLPRRRTSRIACWSLVAALAGGVGWAITPTGPAPAGAAGRADTVAIAAAAASPDHPNVAMEQIVAAGDSVFALAADHQAVYEWSEGQANWQKVKGATQKLYAGGDTVYAIEQGSGDIMKYGGDPNEWNRIGGPGATFAATSKKLYGISPDHKLVMEYTGKGDVWRKVGDRAENLYTGPDKALYATNPVDKSIVKYDGKWTVVGGPGDTFAVTDNNFYGLTPDRRTVVEYDPGKNKWRRVGGPAGTIFASNTLYATNQATGDLYKYNGRPDLWNRISGPAAAFATSGDHLYRLAPDRRSVQAFVRRGVYQEWKNLGAPAAVPAASPAEKSAYFNTLNQEGAASRKAWKAARDAHRKAIPDPYEFRWSTDFCSSPGPDIAFGIYDFRVACARHDFLYRNYRDIYGEKAFQNNPDGQVRIDEILRADMFATCAEHFLGSEQVCQTVATSYYELLRLHSQADG
ncbi:phospholipase A2 [Streptomyces sp. NBC_00029]|uniref:phospholipase A2 n=1 Tax=Streptomyces sp. NBC_00029 TaxID=2903613 RepID=UPI0032532279